jgi:hypothetical protein
MSCSDPRRAEIQCLLESLVRGGDDADDDDDGGDGSRSIFAMWEPL